MSRIAEIREELGELREQVGQFATIMESEKRSLNDEESTKLDDLTTEIRARERSLEQMASIADLRPEERQRPAADREPAQPTPGDGSEERSALSIGERAIRSDAYQRARKNGVYSSRSQSADVDFGVSLTRSETRALVHGGDASTGVLVQPDVKPLQPRRLTPIEQVLSLVNQGSTDKDSVTVPLDTSTAFDDAAFIVAPTDTTAAGSEKPETSLTFGKLEFPVRLVAALLPVWRAQLDDVPFLKSYIDNRLIYQVRRRFARGIINGTGTGESFTGILNTPGIGTQPKGADTTIDAISRAIENIELAEYEPNAILMHPSDLWKIRRVRNNLAVTNPGATPTTVETGDYLFGGPNGISLPTPWGLQPVPTVLVPQGTALVGDFAQATMFWRQGLQVFTSDSHKDWFSKNIIAVLGEARAAFGVEVPAAFTKVTGI